MYFYINIRCTETYLSFIEFFELYEFFLIYLIKSNLIKLEEV